MDSNLNKLNKNEQPGGTKTQTYRSTFNSQSKTMPFTNHDQNTEAKLVFNQY